MTIFDAPAPFDQWDPLVQRGRSSAPRPASIKVPPPVSLPTSAAPPSRIAAAATRLAAPPSRGSAPPSRVAAPSSRGSSRAPGAPPSLATPAPVAAGTPFVTPAPKPGKADAEFIIHFDFNSAAMTEDAMGVAYNVMAATVGGVKTVLLTGHTDTAGDKAYNRQLSEARVEAVKNAFSEIGIDPTKIVTQFYGEDEPAEKTGDGVKNAKNRRVTVILKF